jgi:hypothetical protein
MIELALYKVFPEMALTKCSQFRCRFAKPKSDEVKMVEIRFVESFPGYGALKKHFSLIEDLKNITSFLTDDFDFFIHWIPSHIENTSVGKLPIRGNVNADKLAGLALEQK